MKVIVLILTLTTLTANATDEKFFEALHQIETSGRVGRILGDRGAAQGPSIGPYQISKPYWLDATYKSPELRRQGYGSVAGLHYSQRIVYLYAMRYEPSAVKNKDYEVLARLHNSGPAWRKKKHLTDKYWAKFKKLLKD